MAGDLLELDCDCCQVPPCGIDCYGNFLVEGVEFDSGCGGSAILFADSISKRQLMGVDSTPSGLQQCSRTVFTSTVGAWTRVTDYTLYTRNGSPFFFGGEYYYAISRVRYVAEKRTVSSTSASVYFGTYGAGVGGFSAIAETTTLYEITSKSGACEGRNTNSPLAPFNLTLVSFGASGTDYALAVSQVTSWESVNDSGANFPTRPPGCNDLDGPVDSLYDVKTAWSITRTGAFGTTFTPEENCSVICDEYSVDVVGTRYNSNTGNDWGGSSGYFSSGFQLPFRWKKNLDDTTPPGGDYTSLVSGATDYPQAWSINYRNDDGTTLHTFAGGTIWGWYEETTELGSEASCHTGTGTGNLVCGTPVGLDPNPHPEVDLPP